MLANKPVSRVHEVIIIDLHDATSVAFGHPVLRNGEIEFVRPSWATATEPTHVKLIGYRYASPEMRVIAQCLRFKHSLGGVVLPDCIHITLHGEIEA